MIVKLKPESNDIAELIFHFWHHHNSHIFSDDREVRIRRMRRRDSALEICDNGSGKVIAYATWTSESNESQIDRNLTIVQSNQATATNPVWRRIEEDFARIRDKSVFVVDATDLHMSFSNPILKFKTNIKIVRRKDV